MKGEITHTGRIVEITPEFTTVEIVSESACASCHAKALCGLGESKTKAVQVPTKGWENRNPGDEVTLVLKASMGHKAVWIAYVIPLAVLMAGLLVSSSLGASELVSGLVALGSVAVYYAAVRLFRDRLRNEYIFNIR